MTTIESRFDLLGRFGRPAQQVLAVLSTGPRVPSKIASEVDVQCGMDLGPGTLFGTLARLERHGLISVVPADTAPRAYRLTALGAEAFEARLLDVRRGLPSSRPAINGSAAR